MRGLARRYNGTDEYHEVASGIVTAPPISVYMRVRFRSSAAGTFLSMQRSGIGNWDGFYAELTSGSIVIGTPVNNNFSASWSSPAMIRTWRWYDIIAVWASTTSRYGIINGKTPLPPNTTSGTPTGVPNRFSIGASRHGAITDNYSSVDVERIGVWSAVLNLSDAARLMRGEFETVRRREIVDMWAMNGLRAGASDEGSLLNKNTLSDVNAPDLIRVNAPPLMPPRRLYVSEQAAAGSTIFARRSLTPRIGRRR